MYNINKLKSSAFAAVSAFVFSAIFVGASVIPGGAAESVSMFV